MLALVSSMTTTVIGCTSLMNRSSDCGLSLSKISKIFLRQIGNQALLGVGDGGVERDRAGARAERRLLREGRKASAKQQSSGQDTTS